MVVDAVVTEGKISDEADVDEDSGKAGERTGAKEELHGASTECFIVLQ